MDNRGKEGSFKVLFAVMIFSMIIAFMWPAPLWLSDSVHSLLDPSFGKLLNWHLTGGMLIIITLFSIITNLFQKYTTDQETIRELKKQQKEINKQMKEFAHDPEKVMEIQQELFPLTGRLMKLSIRPIMFTAVPFVLFFRWFGDVFTAMGNPKFFGFLGWIWFYLIFTIIISSILRKVLKVA